MGDKAMAADAADLEVKEEQPREVQDWDWVMAEGEVDGRGVAAGDGGGASARGQKRARSGAVAGKGDAKETAQQSSVGAASVSAFLPLPAPQRPLTSASSSSVLPSSSSALSSTSTAFAGGVDWSSVIAAVAAELRQPAALPSPGLSLLRSLLSALPDEAVSSASVLDDDPASSLWPHLPALYQSVASCPSSAPPTPFSILLSALLRLASSRPALVLLARTQADTASSSSSSSSSSTAATANPLLLADDATARNEEEKRLQSARRHCLWSTLTATIGALSSSPSPSLLLRPLYGLCASLYPSTLSLLDRYGDATGTVGPALDALRLNLRSTFLTPDVPLQLLQGGAGMGASSTLLPLFRSALPVLRVVLLTQSPLDPADSSDPAAPSPHSLPALRSSSTSSSASFFPSPSSSTTLVSYPVVISERSLYLPSLSPFSVSAVSPSHPDLEPAELQAEATGWMAQLTHSIILATQRCTSSPAQAAASGSVYLSLVQDTLLFITRQRSHAYHDLVVPALLSFAEALTSQVRYPPSASSPSLLSSSQSSSLLHLLRLGLFGLFRLQSCAAHFVRLAGLLSQPANSILAMETNKIHKQRLQAQPTLYSLTPQLQPLQQPAQPSTAASHAIAPGASSTSPLVMAALSEVVQLSEPTMVAILTSSARLPLLPIVHLVLGVLYRSQTLQPPPPSVAPQPAILALAIALLQQRADAHNATSPDIVPMQDEHKAAITAPSALTSSMVASSPSASSLRSGGVSPSSSLSLSLAELASLSRASFVRLLSLSTAEEVALQQGGGLRSALLTALATRTTGDEAIVLTISLPSRATLRSLQSAAQTTAESSDAAADESTSAVLSSLSLTSSLTSSPLFGALLNDVLTDLTGRYELALALLYRLAQLTPPLRPAAPPVTSPSLQPLITWHVEVNEEEDEEEHEVGQGEVQGADDVAALDVKASNGGTASMQMEERRTEEAVGAVEGAEQAQDDGEAAVNTAKLGKAEEEGEEGAAADGAAPAVESNGFDGEGGALVDAVWSASDMQRSPAFLALMSAHLRRVGGVEYGEVVSSLLAAFDSRLFIEDQVKQEANEAASPSSSSPSLPFSLRYNRLFTQFLLDLPLLPPAVWSTLSRYVEQAATAAVAVNALQALLTFRPPAATPALRCLLDCLRHSEDDDVRQRGVRLAVELACRRHKDRAAIAAEQAMDDGTQPAPPPTKVASTICAAIVDCAVALASAAASSTFLADLPSISVNIVVPPVPVYEQIQVKQEQLAPFSALPADSASASTEPYDGIPAAPATATGGDDGSQDADEARRREIQQLIAAAGRRQKEFDKLVLRRALLIKEKEALEAQAKERDLQRSSRTDRHLDLFIALLTHSALDGAPLASHAPRMFECLFSVYQAAAAADPARKALHQALPGVVARTGPSLALLQGIRSGGSGADACMLHALQLLCNNPLEPSHPPFAAPSSAASTSSSSSSSSVLVYITSPVYNLCWELYSARQGDARFVIPILPIVRGDALRRCLHRLVLLPPAHMKVAFTRLLKPTASLHAKGNKLSTFIPTTAQQQSGAAPLSPAELVIALHRVDHARRVQLQHPSPPHSQTDPATLFPADDSVWLRSLISACQLCYSFVELFPPPVFLSILTALRSDRPLSRLLMRTALQVHSLYPALTSFLLDLTAHLLQTERQMVEQGAMWEGALKMAQLTLPHSLDLLLTLPDLALDKLFKGYTPPVPGEDGHPPPVPLPSKSASPLVQCRTAVVAFVISNPYRVRPYLAAKVMGGGGGGAGEFGDGAAAAAGQMQGRHPLGGAAQGSGFHPAPAWPPPMFAPHLPPLPPGAFPAPATAAAAQPPHLLGSAAPPARPPPPASSTGWSSSSLRPLAPSPSYPPQPAPFHPSGASFPPSPYYPHPPGPMPAAPPPGGVGLTPPSFSASSAVAPAPTASAGGWKSVRIPTAGATGSTGLSSALPSHPQPPPPSHSASSEPASQQSHRSRR